MKNYRTMTINYYINIDIFAYVCYNSINYG